MGRGVPAQPRMVKILEAFESVEPAMMDSLHEDQRVGATAGLRDWASKPTAVTAERVLSKASSILTIRGTPGIREYAPGSVGRGRDGSARQILA